MHRTPNPVPYALLSLVVLAACGEGPTEFLDVGTDPEAPELAPATASARTLNVEGYLTDGPVRRGFIYGRDGAPLEITYEVQGGLAIWQGDIVLGRADRIAASLLELPGSEAGPLLGSVIDDDAKRWPGGVVPYTIGDAPFPNRVTNAIQLIEDQTPGITFVLRTAEANYITFQDSDGCSSSIGMIGGQQFINLASDCSTGNAAHEILHALGMYHEHTRCDRDGFVTIDYTQIEAGKEGNFYKAGSGTQDGACSGSFDIGTYDFGSMMHYPLDAFAIGAMNTITPIVAIPAGTVIGQRSQVGPTDQQTIDQLYGANNAAPSATLAALAASYPEGSPVPFNASGSTDADDSEDILTFAWTFGDATCSVVTPPAKCSQAAPSHAYADNGAYDVEVTVSDGFDSDAESTVVTITNVAPSVSVGGDGSVDEGSEFARSGSFSDPGADTWSATVDYGDGGGAMALGLTGKSFDLAHTYADNGSPTITVAVTDDDAGVGQGTIDVTVNNVAPTVDAGPDAEVESGQTFDFTGSFTDPGVVDAPWAWVIEWGFGDDTEGSTDDQAAPIQASRQMCVAGDYVVRLTVTDKDAGAGMDEALVSVPYIAVLIDIMPGTDLNPVSLNKKGQLPVVIFGSADFDATAVDPSSLVLGDEVGSDTGATQKNNGTWQTSLEDVNDDGYMDRIVAFPTAGLVSNGDLTSLSSELVLRGFLDDACSNFRGADAVTPN